MPTNQSGWDAKKPARLEGFGTKQETTETPKETDERPATAKPATVRARLEFAAAAPPAPPVQETPRVETTPRVEAPRVETARPAVSGSTPRPTKNAAYTPDPDAERVTQRKWWKYDLYKRSGRTDGGTT
jgi:hypothetical protein